jgi:hypothetical protein
MVIKPVINPGIMSCTIAKMNTGIDSVVLIQNLRLISVSSWFSLFLLESAFGCRAMPHLEQEPGSWRKISGCIGQTYSVGLAGVLFTAFSNAIPHCGQLPGCSWRILGCMGQE